MLNPDEKIKRAKTWGIAHGYYGMIGGWIGREGRMDCVCQGWLRLYGLCHAHIERWFTHRAGFSSGDLVWYAPATYPPGHLAAEIVEFTTKRVRIKVEKDQGQVPQIITRVVSFGRLEPRRRLLLPVRSEL